MPGSYHQLLDIDSPHRLSYDLSDRPIELPDQLCVHQVLELFALLSL